MEQNLYSLYIPSYHEKLLKVKSFLLFLHQNFVGENTKDTEDLKFYDFSGRYKKINLRNCTDFYGR
jgi:hypothetical protein